MIATTETFNEDEKFKAGRDETDVLVLSVGEEVILK